MFSQEGATALHYALREGYSDIAKLLLDKGADISATTNVSNIILYI